MKKMWHMYMVVYSSVKKDILSTVTTQINLEDIRLSEISQYNNFVCSPS